MEDYSRSAAAAVISAPTWPAVASTCKVSWSVPGTKRQLTSAPVAWCGRQGVFAKIPGLDWAYRAMTR